MQRFAKYLKPNSIEKGISGVHDAVINVPDLTAVRSFVQGIFPAATSEDTKIRIQLDDGSIEFAEAQSKERLVLFARANSPDIPEGRFQIEDVAVKTTYALSNQNP